MLLDADSYKLFDIQCYKDGGYLRPTPPLSIALRHFLLATSGSRKAPNWRPGRSSTGRLTLFHEAIHLERLEFRDVLTELVLSLLILAPSLGSGTSTFSGHGFLRILRLPGQGGASTGRCLSLFLLVCETS